MISAAPFFSFAVRRRVAYALLGLMGLVIIVGLVWTFGFGHDLPAVAMLQFPIWVGLPFLILGSVAREEAALKLGRPLAGPPRMAMIMAIIVAVITLGIGVYIVVARH